jgi:beta-lactamase superfamily II metal-dependent hydrolase
MRKLASRAVGYLPTETLTDVGETTERNNSSVITLFTIDERRILLTGDAGIPALTNAFGYMESQSSASLPLFLVQVPHHGSRRNVGPTVLNRLLGPVTGATRGQAIVSASEKAPKHPSPKVVNAFRRRGYPVYSTEEQGLCFHNDMPTRPGWTSVAPLPPLDESGEEDD